MNTTDRRVRKTRRALQDALSELIGEKELRSITIHELTERADVHRATFYAHYEDIYDLYRQMEDSILADIDAIVCVNPDHSYEALFRAMIDYFRDNAAFCRMMFGEHANAAFRDRVSALLEEKYMEICLYGGRYQTVTEERRFQAKYHIQGFIALLGRWVKSGFSYPIDEIGNIIIRLNDNMNILLMEG